MVRQYGTIIVSLALAFLFSVAAATSLELRNPGDTLWSQCKNISYIGYSLPNSCIILKEADDCALNVVVSVSGNIILSQNMDLSVVPSVCGTYYGCDVCVEINPNPNNANQRCVQVQPTCSGFSPPASTVGCFPNSILADLLTCESSKCPNDCNGHGTCSHGSCTCNEGWYGDDCNTTGNSEVRDKCDTIGALFDACQQVDALGASICVRLDFDECNIVTQVVIEGNGQEIKVFNEPYPVEEFKTVFQEDQCVNVGVCSICLEWDNLVLTEVQASGCGTINLDCLGTQYAYPLGCFQDDTVVPKCFGTCPNNCSYNGYCYRGICQCIESYTGKDCSIRTYPPCKPADCNGHGSCIMGQCRCDEHWGNADCNTYLSNQSSHQSSKGTSLMAILVPIFLVVAIAIAAVIIYLVKRKSKQTGPKFTQLELVDDEEDNSLVNSTEDDK